MNRRTLVIVIAVLALAGFAAAALIYTRARGPVSPPPGPVAAAPLAPAEQGPIGAPPIPATSGEPAAAMAPEAARGPEAPAASAAETALVRAQAPTLGPADAKVTIVEFFDPACEACRAFYPIVKRTMAQYPADVRLVLRYAPLHPGSDEAVRILETARLQNLFIPVLEALLARQPEWAAHGSMDLEHAWKIAGDAGLDVPKARAARLSPRITAALNRDIQDLKTVGVTQTPSFFVNGKPLQDFGVRQFQELVRAEVAAAP